MNESLELEKWKAGILGQFLQHSEEHVSYLAIVPLFQHSMIMLDRR